MLLSCKFYHSVETFEDFIFKKKGRADYFLQVMLPSKNNADREMYLAAEEAKLILSSRQKKCKKWE